MFSRYIFLVGTRYGISQGHSHLVSFISRLSTAGLVIGVALLILVMSIMNGFDKELRENILGVMPHARIYHSHAIKHPEKLIADLKQHPRVLAASPYVELQGLLSYQKRVAPVAIFGVDAELEKATSKLPGLLPKGTLESLATAEAGIVIGRGVAEKLNVAEADSISLIIPVEGGSSPRVKVVTVFAIFDTHSDVDNALALMDINAAAELSGYAGQITGVRLKVDDLFAAPEIVRGIMQTLPQDYYGSSWMATHGGVYQSIKMSKNMVGMLLFLIIAIAAFNLVSTLIMVVVDKQGDIAILRTMGASTAEIITIFMVQGGLIGLIGTSIGLVLGVTLSYFVTPLVQWIEKIFGVQFLHSDVYPITYLPSELVAGDIAKVVITALLISFFVSLYPAWRASKIQPADALRYE
ncbi:lipoprotein-releasing ABC transporter permease subunit [Cellvibrio fibrivorans]|uniref:Lipoprotein-releasing system permease protein n=1 Tax=Cellvibrio fibrivorans TaxID=126350 RepID=A0ABU1UWY4_9GAMM|nr:lipoprotein-releasing ABC transporter permease subunit [Cellvibrio fibrivorans]MDR7089700.1 lipoprotein-releasing system permease protein [Cellvibrio fibrivorans]